MVNLANIRSPAEREKVLEDSKEDYISGKYKNQEIADKHGLSIHTFRGWISKYGWASQKKSKTRGAKPGNKNAEGNKGGAPKGNKHAEGNCGGPPKGSRNAEKFGFFSKVLPEETLKLIEEIDLKSPLDILWENITIQYAAILRAQKIMYVEAKDEMIKELKKAKYDIAPAKDGEGIEMVPVEEEYEFQFAWDRQATFLSAQSRAMSELRNMISKYEDMVHNSKLATEEQKLKVEKLKADIEHIQSNEKDKPIEIAIVRKGGRDGPKGS